MSLLMLAWVRFLSRSNHPQVIRGAGAKDRRCSLKQSKSQLLA